MRNHQPREKPHSSAAEFERERCGPDPSGSLAVPRASRGSLGGVNSEAGEAWAAPALPGGDLGGGRHPLPSPGPGLHDATGRICSALPRPPPPHPLQTEKDLSPLNIQTFFVFIFFFRGEVISSK